MKEDIDFIGVRRAVGGFFVDEDDRGGRVLDQHVFTRLQDVLQFIVDRFGKENQKVVLKMSETKTKQEKNAEENNEKVSHVLDFGEYGSVKFQKGPCNEVERNGIYLADDEEPDFLSAVISHIQSLAAVIPSWETSLAITRIQEARLWLLQRKFDRKARGVLGTYKV